MEVFIDKIENKIAELHFDDEQIVYMKLKYLPKGIKEGDYLDINFILNKSKRKEVENSVKELINELSSSSDGGDFEI